MKLNNGIALLGDCFELMKDIPDRSIDCIITSPPYNKGYWSRNRNINNGFKTKSRRIQYGDFNDDLSPEEYEIQQRKLLTEFLRILKEDGSIFYNHIDILHKHTTIHPKYVYDFPVKQIIIWNRKNTPKLDKSYFYPINEYIFWIKKHKDAIPYFDRKQADFQKNIWDISPARNNDHPAPFPLEIAINCIKATTKEQATIFDPYAGSFTTALASENTNRKWICIEKDEGYFNAGIERVSKNSIQN